MESESNTNGSTWSYSQNNEYQNNRVVDQTSNNSRNTMPKWEYVSSDDDDIYVENSEEMSSRDERGNESSASSSASSSFIFTEEDVLVTARTVEVEGSSTLCSPPTSPTKQREMNPRIVAVPSPPTNESSQHQINQDHLHSFSRQKDELVASPPSSSLRGSTTPLGMAALFSRHADTLSPSKPPANSSRKEDEAKIALLVDRQETVTRNQQLKNSHSSFKARNDQLHVTHDSLVHTPLSSTRASGKVAMLSQFFDSLSASPSSPTDADIVSPKGALKTFAMTPIEVDSRASKTLSPHGTTNPPLSHTLGFDNRSSFHAAPDRKIDINGRQSIDDASTEASGIRLRNQYRSCSENESVWNSALSQPSTSMWSRNANNLNASVEQTQSPLHLDQMEEQEVFADEEDPTNVLVEPHPPAKTDFSHHPVGIGAKSFDKAGKKEGVAKKHDEDITLPLIEDDSISKTIPSLIVRGAENENTMLTRCWNRHGLAYVVFLLFVVMVALVAYIVDKQRPISFGLNDGVDEVNRDETQAPTISDFEPPRSDIAPSSPSPSTATKATLDPPSLPPAPATLHPTLVGHYAFNQLVWTQLIGDDESSSSYGRNGDENDQAMLLGGSRAGSRFGSSLAMSANGKIVAVAGPGSRQDQVGYVQVMEWDDTELRWIARGRPLQSPSRSRDGFGVAVDINDDGTIIAIAAVGNMLSVRSSIENVPTGCAFVFEYLPNRFDWSSLGSLE